jgi:hypothetical protein
VRDSRALRCAMWTGARARARVHARCIPQERVSVRARLRARGSSCVPSAASRWWMPAWRRWALMEAASRNGPGASQLYDKAGRREASSFPSRFSSSGRRFPSCVPSSHDDARTTGSVFPHVAMPRHCHQTGSVFPHVAMPRRCHQTGSVFPHVAMPRRCHQTGSVFPHVAMPRRCHQTGSVFPHVAMPRRCHQTGSVFPLPAMPCEARAAWLGPRLRRRRGGSGGATAAAASRRSRPGGQTATIGPRKSESSERPSAAPSPWAWHRVRARAGAGAWIAGPQEAGPAGARQPGAAAGGVLRT